MKLKNLLFSLAAAAAGGAIGYFVASGMEKKKYEKLMQEEGESLRATLHKLSKEKKAPEPELPEAPAEKQDEAAETESLRKDAKAAMKRYSAFDSEPYQIRPEVFGEFEDYETITLYYTADDILLDDQYQQMSEDEIANSVGDVSLCELVEDHMDAIYVRNERRNIDYEVLSDERTYQELAAQQPHIVS